MITLNWSNLHDIGFEETGSKTFDTDKDLLDFMMDQMSELVDPKVYEMIDRGLTIYNPNKDEVEELEDESGQDSWDGQSLVRWISEVLESDQGLWVS